MARVVTVGLLAILLGLSGCDSAAEGRRPTVPVEVMVTYNGEPIENATVTFVATDDSTPAFGRTDADGKTSITTFNPGDGAVIAGHMVTVTKMELDPKAKLAEENVVDMDDPAYDPSDPPSVAPPRNLLPQKYALPANSGLTAEVKKGEKNEFRFELTD